MPDKILIVFVPVGATQRDFETALREHLPSLTANPEQAEATRPGPTPPAAQPLWTWFLPNPGP